MSEKRERPSAGGSYVRIDGKLYPADQAPQPKAKAKPKKPAAKKAATEQPSDEG